MTDLRNTLFYYATKELSQDAFICWLCSFSLEGSRADDRELVRCSCDLIRTFMTRGLEKNGDDASLQLISVEKQVGNIDILLTVKFDNEIFKVIIEDKVNSHDHDNQLQRYRNDVEKEGYKVIGIYFITGFQSDLSRVYDADYKVFDRKDMLKLLRECKSENEILKDFRAYWENFEEIACSYKSGSLDEWADWQAVNGFYDEMQVILTDTGLWSGYGYVPNAGGGFWGLWYGIKEDVVEKETARAALYLQVETAWDDGASRYNYKICLKFENRSERDNDEIGSLKDLVLNTQGECGFERPARMRSGSTMTIGVLSGVDESPTYEEFKKIIMSSSDRYKELLDRLKALINN
ncbi:MAG: PD-(D/E)XK nuclease family protein [Lachnospiraceae bacterium]|nr:PD-(D/E)XK nuclease family protein [Lachnospiraceae bacterium]